jgi:predicted nucleotidyltransferase component of viral defense system
MTVAAPGAVKLQTTDQVKDVQQMLKDVASSFLLYSLNYRDMFGLPNAIFRGYTFLFISYFSFSLRFG